MTNPRDERGRFANVVAIGQTFTTDDPKWAELQRRTVKSAVYAINDALFANSTIHPIAAHLARQRVLDQAVRNVEAQRCMGWWHPPTYIGDDLAAAYRAEFARLWAEQ